MKIDEVPSLARKSRVAAHTHIKVRVSTASRRVDGPPSARWMTSWWRFVPRRARAGERADDD